MPLACCLLKVSSHPPRGLYLCDRLSFTGCWVYALQKSLLVSFALGLRPACIPTCLSSWPPTAYVKLWLRWLFVELLRKCRVGDSCACLLLGTVSMQDCSPFITKVIFCIN